MNSSFLASRMGILSVILIGAALRLLLPWLGHNYDVESWQIVGSLVHEGKNVFNWTDRHNYGPGLFPLFGLAQYVSVHAPWKHPELFHFGVAFFLTLSDLGIFWLLIKRFSRAAAALFFLNPISILITGYHSQVDTIAIFFAFAAWLLYESDNRSQKTLLYSAVLLGISLIIKHSFIFFPLWLLFDPRWKSRSEKSVYLMIAYALFLASFLPFCGTLDAQNRILHNVFQYTMGSSNSMLSHLFQLFIPLAFLFQFTNVDVFLKYVFILLLLGLGWFVMRREPRNAFYFYLISLVVFASQMADQYLVIPVLACAVFMKNRWLMLYTAACTIFILGSPFNLYLWPRITGYAFLTSVNMNGFWWYYHCQIWLLLFLAFRYLQLRPNEKDRSPLSSVC